MQAEFSFPAPTTEDRRSTTLRRSEVPPVPQWLIAWPRPKAVPKRKAKVLKFTNSNLVWVKLADQAPRIGSGWRQVEVVTNGYKWSTVRSWPGGRSAAPVRHRFKLNDWERISNAKTNV